MLCADLCCGDLCVLLLGLCCVFGLLLFYSWCCVVVCCVVCPDDDDVVAFVYVLCVVCECKLNMFVCLCIVFLMLCL